MRILVTGRGSIAQRHARHLRFLRPDLALAVISSTGEVDASLQPCTVFGNMQAALLWKPEAIVVASISSKHADEIEICLRLGLPCLFEKPLVINSEQFALIEKACNEKSVSNALIVGCNLRYLPALQKLKRVLSGAVSCRVLRAHFEVGQALSQWRPSRDLRTTYSVDAASGGGVVFDLVHEIDMARWLLGPLQVHAAIGGHFSALPIQSDDVSAILLKTVSGVPVFISLDYVSQQAVRKYTIVTDAGTFSVDIMGKNIVLHTDKKSQVVTNAAEDFDIPQTYQSQIADWLWAMADHRHEVASPFVDGLKTAELMLNIKQASL